ncbi:MAG: ArdC family protein, partial [Alphaproteobacteria bacterium]|nr:ArdC family protein [Alphaproteobacteria bacterium]
MAIDFATEVANIIIEQLQKGTAPWQKPWDPGEYRSEAHNPISDNRYRGINSLVLEMKNHDDPRWMTYRQAAAKGYQVRKGEKATTIEYWQWTKSVKALDDNGKVMTDAEGREKVVKVQLTRPRIFYAKVF